MKTPPTTKDILAFQNTLPLNDLPEAYRPLNSSSRALVRACKQGYGEAWIYTINPTSYSPICRPYEGGKVWNFCGSFVAPVYDQTLVDMIESREKSTWSEYTSEKDWRRVCEIHNRAESIGAAILLWS